MIRYYPVNRDYISIETVSPLVFVLVWQGPWGNISLQISQPEPVSNLHFAWRIGHAEISLVICMEFVFSAKAGTLIDCLHEVCEIKCHTFICWACAEAVHLLTAFSIQSVRNRP